MKSSLATGELLAPIMTNTWGARPGAITKFTPHCAVGLLSAKRICEILNSKGASANYVIGKDGEIWCNVREETAPGTSSNRTNDQQAITVECACDLNSPYKFPDKVWDSLVALAKDIVKRYGFGKLVYTGNGNGSLTYHRMFVATACPGQWFVDNTQRFLDAVNNGTGNTKPETPSKPNNPGTGKLNTQQLAEAIKRGDFGNAPARWDNLKNAGYTQAEIDAAQAIVNGGQAAPQTPSKPAFDANKLAEAIKRGDYGNAPARWENLKKAGYTQDQINAAQAIVDGGQAVQKPSAPAFNATDLARRIARGDFGNEPQRTPALKKAGFTDNQIRAAQDLVNKGKY